MSCAAVITVAVLGLAGCGTLDETRATLAVGEAVGRGGSFADDFVLESSKAVGSSVVLDMRPRSETGFVLSALYDGPVLFATC